MLLDRIDKKNAVTGRKQTLRAIASGSAKVVFIARDADDALRQEIEKACAEYKVICEYADTMVQLGKAAGIEVGASACAILNRT